MLRVCGYVGLCFILSVSITVRLRYDKFVVFFCETQLNHEGKGKGLVAGFEDFQNNERDECVRDYRPFGVLGIQELRERDILSVKQFGKP